MNGGLQPPLGRGLSSTGEARDGAVGDGMGVPSWSPMFQWLCFCAARVLALALLVFLPELKRDVTETGETVSDELPQITPSARR